VLVMTPKVEASLLNIEPKDKVSCIVGEMECCLEGVPRLRCNDKGKSCEPDGINWQDHREEVSRFGSSVNLAC
jgi:hypothetical protein